MYKSAKWSRQWASGRSCPFIRHARSAWTLPTPESLTGPAEWSLDSPDADLDTTDATPSYPLDSPDESNSLNLIPSE